MKPTKKISAPKSAKELQKMIEEKRVELFGLELKLTLGQLTQTSSIRNVKREIARMLTLEKQRGKDAATK